MYGQKGLLCNSLGHTAAAMMKVPAFFFYLFFPFFLLNFIGGMQGQRVDTSGWEMNRIEMHGMKGTKNK